jgi:hypothetical protein
MTQLPCIICRKELESALPPEHMDGYTNQPYGGTCFHSYGHYGSTFYDLEGSPLSPRYIAVNICDDCLRKAMEDFIILEYEERGKHLVSLPADENDPPPLTCNHEVTAKVGKHTYCTKCSKVLREEVE